MDPPGGIHADWVMKGWQKRSACAVRSKTPWVTNYTWRPAGVPMLPDGNGRTPRPAGEGALPDELLRPAA